MNDFNTLIKILSVYRVDFYKSNGLLTWKAKRYGTKKWIMPDSDGYRCIENAISDLILNVEVV